MKRNTLILIAIVATVLLFFSYCQFWSGGEDKTPPPVDSEQMGSLPPTNETTKPKAQVPPPSPEVEGTPGFLPTQMEDPAKYEAFQKHLKEMAGCLNMKVGTLDPQEELNFETFNKIISPDLGDIVSTGEEWTATDIRTKSGELRRIYIEKSLEPDQQSQRKLKYYSFGPGGESKEIPLSSDQSANPTDTLIASLESDGDVVGISVSRRMYYQNGDDLLVVEKNGKIYSFELPHDGKTFKCTGADSAKTMHCECR